MTSSSSRSSLPLRVGLDLRLAGYRAGGIARYAAELQRALADVPDVAVVPLRSRHDRAPALHLWTPPHHRQEERAIPVELLLRRVRLDVYHAPDFIVPCLRRTPAVATVHDLSFVHWPDDHTPASLAYYRRLRDAVPRTRAWITPSVWTADDLAAIYSVSRDTIHVVPHGVSLGLEREPPLPRSARRHLLAVGTVEPRKRYDLLLDACALDPRLPPLLVVGHPGWRSATTEARLRATPNVTWLSSTADSDLRRLYREALALVLPSRGEGFGLPALEAMAAGTPVVASPTGAVPELTGDAALYPDDTPEAWAATLTHLATDDTRWASLATAARRRAAPFTWSQTARRTAAVYRTLAP